MALVATEFLRRMSDVRRESVFARVATEFP